MRQVYSRVCASLLIGALLVAAGCGGEKSKAEQPTKMGTSAGLTTYAVKSVGFQIGVPTSWKSADVDQVVDDDLIDKMSADPQLAQYAQALKGPGSPLKLFAFDPDVQKAFATNLNVLVGRLPGLSREKYFSFNVEQLKGYVGGDGTVEQTRVTLPAGPALRLEYLQPRSPSANMDISTFQYLL